jgi:hypothetical protein
MALLRCSCFRVYMDFWWLRSHPNFSVSTTNLTRNFEASVQGIGFSLSNRRDGWKFCVWSTSFYHWTQEDLFGKLMITKITLFLYFFGVMFSGINTNVYLFILARFVTGLRLICNYAALEASLQQFLQPSMSLCHRSTEEE